jgi:hypothetical protein
VTGQRGAGVRKALLEVSPQGVVTVPYSTGMALKRRGYGEEIGDRRGDVRSVPLMTIRLNEAGLEASHAVREQDVYDKTRASVESELDEMISQGVDLFAACAQSHKLVARLEDTGQSSAGARAYRDVLMAHCRQEVGM